MRKEKIKELLGLFSELQKIQVKKKELLKSEKEIERQLVGFTFEEATTPEQKQRWLDRFREKRGSIHWTILQKKKDKLLNIEIEVLRDIKRSLSEIVDRDISFIEILKRRKKIEAILKKMNDRRVSR